MKFNSKVVDRGAFDAMWPEKVVKNEPMFFNCDLSFAYKNGGDITRAFLDALPTDWLASDPVLDSRVHMLMPGWYPCIPGYHHDDVPRSAERGQPNYVNPEYRSDHLMGLVNGEICPTEFATGEVYVRDLHLALAHGNVYKAWHEDVVQWVELGQCEKFYPASGRLVQFDWQAFHTGTAAIKGGWRWFVRLSRNTDRQKKITNEIRRQVQVYMGNLTEGW